MNWGWLNLVIPWLHPCNFDNSFITLVRSRIVTRQERHETRRTVFRAGGQSAVGGRRECSRRPAGPACHRDWPQGRRPSQLPARRRQSWSDGTRWTASAWGSATASPRQILRLYSRCGRVSEWVSGVYNAPFWHSSVISRMGALFNLHSNSRWPIVKVSSIKNTINTDNQTLLCKT